jgi:Uma2 family endonuclease
MLAELIQELEQEGQDTSDQEVCLMIDRVSWQQYETFLKKLEDNAYLRVTYLDGVLEFVSPSRWHEGIKKRIATLLEAYFEATDTAYFPLGSTTFRQQEKRGGSEPDESYCIGVEKEIPDLVVEIALTSGGIDKLAVYQRLGIPEVWVWQNDRLLLYQLQEQQYQAMDHSCLLPNLDLNQFASYILHPDQLTAIKEFRRFVRETRA